MRNGWVFSLVLLMAANACAFETTLYIADINNRQPIDQAQIVIVGNESQTLNDTLTNADGFGNVTINETLTYYTTTISKVGYHTQILNYTWTVDATESVYMFPISTDGLVRIRFNDLTGQSRSYCILYYDNNRIEGCYLANATATLIVNQQYIIVPDLFWIDLLASASSIQRNILLFSGLFIGLMALIVIFGVPLAIFINMLRKGKRRGFI